MKRCLNCAAAGLVVCGALTVGVFSSDAIALCTYQCYRFIDVEAACKFSENGCCIKYAPFTARNIWSDGKDGTGAALPLDCNTGGLDMWVQCTSCVRGCSTQPDGVWTQGIGAAKNCESDPLKTDICFCDEST
jgi:hypothetical protein